MTGQTILLSEAEATVQGGLLPDGHPRETYHYFGKTSPYQPGAEGFRAMCAPGRTVGAHFHDVDQFQVFFGVPGAFFQRQQIAGVLLQYTDAYSTYGPFGAKVQALRFFTLRPGPSSMTGYMPKHRGQLKYRGIRRIEVALDEHLDKRRRPERGHEVIPLFEPHADGVAAWVYLAGPGADFTLGPPPGSVQHGGCYIIVLDGAVSAESRAYGPQSLGWLGPDASPALGVARQKTGAALVVMTLPSVPTPLVHERQLASG